MSFSLSGSLGLIFPLILKSANSMLDSGVNGASLNHDQRKLLYTAYVVASVWGPDIVESTDNTYDDDALDSFLSLIEDTADEGSITLPNIPEEI